MKYIKYITEIQNVTKVDVFKKMFAGYLYRDIRFKKNYISIPKLFNYLSINPFINKHDKSYLNKYYINTTDFIKEIFLNKKIKFIDCRDVLLPKIIEIEGIVEDVKFYFNQPYSTNPHGHLLITVKINDSWYQLSSNHCITIQNYDAYNKPLHKQLRNELEIIDDAKNFNL